MDTLQFLVLVILLKCEGLTMQKIFFSNEQKAWKDAVNYCALTGGVLESNVTLLRDNDDFKTTNEDVWIGKFKTFTEWTYIHGCYSINMTNGNFRHFTLELSKTAELQCQKLCNKYKFYSIKGKDCYCFANISSFVRNTNCSCDGCYKVWEHQLPNFGSANGKDECIATIECDPGKFYRGYDECSQPYYVTCDNDAELKGYYTYYEAAEECEKQNSFIKWHPDNLCDLPSFPQHWTSGTRHEETFIVGKANFTENIKPDKCFILDDDGDEELEENCNTPLFFFCRFGDMIPSQKNVQSDDSGSIAAGIVTSVIVVIVVISVLVFIYRRRLTRKTPTSHESQNNSRLQDTDGLPSNHEISKAPIYHEIDTENFGPRSGKLNCSRAVNNITYDKTPDPKNVNQSANSSILTNLNYIEHQRKLGHTEYDMPKLINETGNSSEADGENSSNYCLAKPIASNTEEELDPYDINKDYDHLNNVMKKEDPITKVYDHLPTAVTEDPTYDHSNLKNVVDNEDFYDHFKNEGDND